MSLADIQTWIQQTPYVLEALQLLAALAGSLLVFLIVNLFSSRLVAGLVRSTQTQYDDVLIDHLKPRRVAYLVALLVLYATSYSLAATGSFLRSLVLVLVLALVAIIIGSILDAVVTIYHQSPVYSGTPIKGYVQIVKLFIFIVAGILAISIASGQSPFILLSGIGAMTAVLLLIFQDTILSLVASLQMTSNDLIRVGDWVSVPAFNADGDVIDVALHAVQIQNWDKSVSVIPTHKVLESGFTNWRDMTQGQGRRIKRSINIDMTSVRLCDEALLQRFEKMALIRDYVGEKRKEIEAYNAARDFDASLPINGRHLTNLGTFRAYVEAYLRDNTTINHDLTLMVRQLTPGPNGIPLEVYAFSSDTNWIRFEQLQSDIFDHLLAVLPEFDLRVYQFPTGVDVKAIGTGEPAV